MDISFLGKLAPHGDSEDAKEFVKSEILAQDSGKGETIDFDSVDYKVGEDGKPLSYANIKSEKEGVEWYRKHHPGYPEGVLRIMSRCAFDDPNAPEPTAPQPPKKRKPVFSIEQREQTIDFD